MKKKLNLLRICCIVIIALATLFILFSGSLGIEASPTVIRIIGAVDLIAVIGLAYVTGGHLMDERK